MKRLGDAELEIMLEIWAAGEPVSSVTVQEKLRGRRDWALPAVVTSLNRLVEKGFLTCKKRGRVNMYSPLVTEREYKVQESRGILDKLFGNSFKGLFAALCDGEDLSDRDIAELRQLLDEMEGK